MRAASTRSSSVRLSAISQSYLIGIDLQRIHAQALGQRRDGAKSPIAASASAACVWRWMCGFVSMYL